MTIGRPRIRTWWLLAWTGWLLLLGPANPALAQSFRVYVNNKAVAAGETIETSTESPVTFSIRLLSGKPPVTIDPTGAGELVQTLSGPGPVLDFTTSYQAGTYEPRITLGTDIQRFKLAAGPAATPWIDTVSRLALLLTWPVVVLIALIVLAPPLYRLIPRLRAIKVGDTELLIGELEASIQKAIDSTIRTLERSSRLARRTSSCPRPLRISTTTFTWRNSSTASACLSRARPSGTRWAPTISSVTRRSRAASSSAASPSIPRTMPPTPPSACGTCASKGTCTPRSLSS